MCFSAQASFVASGGLAVIGTASLLSAKKENKILAFIPLLFAVQQFFEGIQWIYLNNGSISLIAGYGFLFFAFVVWPIYSPVAVYILDKEKRDVMKWFVFLGIAVSMYFLVIIMTQAPVIQELKSCINYNFNFPLKDLVASGYLLVTLAPLIISSRQIFRIFGAVITVLAIISWLFFTIDFTSVWCFFAAIVSSMFFVYIIYDQNKKAPKNQDFN
jgi:hypothetical protein